MDGRIAAIAERTSPGATRLATLPFIHIRDNLSTYEAVVEAVAEEFCAIFIFGACSLLISVAYVLAVILPSQPDMCWL